MASMVGSSWNAADGGEAPTMSPATVAVVAGPGLAQVVRFSTPPAW